MQIWRRTRQSRREGPPLFSSQRCTIQPGHHGLFSSFFWYLEGGVLQQEGTRPSDKKVDGSKRAHTHTCTREATAAFWRREAAPFLCIPPPILSPTNTYRRRGRQAGSRKKMGSVSRTVLETEAPSHSFNALRINFADTCLWGRHTGETLVPLENCGTAERGWLVTPSPDKKKKVGGKHKKPNPRLPTYPPQLPWRPPSPTRFVPFFVVPSPLSRKGNSSPRCLWSGFRRVAPDGTQGV